MKVKTSVTLSEDLVRAIDRVTPKGGSRSDTIERLLKQAFIDRERRERDLKDLELINANADALNEEAEDVLSFQVDL